MAACNGLRDWRPERLAATPGLRAAYGVPANTCSSATLSSVTGP